MKVRNVMAIILMALVISISSSAANQPKVSHASKHVLEKRELKDDLYALSRNMFASLTQPGEYRIKPATKAVHVAKSLELRKTSPKVKEALVRGLEQCRFCLVQNDQAGFKKAFNSSRKLFESIFKLETGEECSHMEA